MMGTMFYLLIFAVTTLYVLRKLLRLRTARQCAVKQKKLNEIINSADKRLRWSATRLAEALKSGEISSTEIVGMYIAHIKKINTFLNAVCGERFEEALKEAAAADKLLSSAKDSKSESRLPPFLGVPMIAKEAHEYSGLPYTCGIPGRRGIVGRRKNPILARCEAAGAIVLCNANVCEGGMWSESFNSIHGCSNNPYDINRTPGGSSGGCGALMGALGGSFAMTADVGGSTRIPSLYNGVFGHKPSGGCISNMRTVPAIHGRINRYCQIGPCSRYARDLMPILRLMAGPLDAEIELSDADEEELALYDAQKVFIRTYSWPNPYSIDLSKKVRFFVVWDQPKAAYYPIRKRHPEMIAAQRAVVDALEKELNVKVTPIKLDKMSHCFDIWSSMILTSNPVHFHETISEGKDPINLYWEILKWFVSGGRLTEHTLPALILAVSEAWLVNSQNAHAKNIKLGEELRDELNKLLGDDGVLIFPSLPQPAPTHNEMGNLLTFAEFAACGIFNTLELPATHVPVGLSSSGLPVGAQLVAANGNDHLTIATAIKLEDLGIARWVPPKH